MSENNTATIIDGYSVAETIRREIREEWEQIRHTLESVPGLAVILVGDRKDSATYVRSKKKAAEELGFRSVDLHLPESTSQDDLIAKIRDFNADPTIHGILVQLPLPDHIAENEVLAEISFEKDVDGFHVVNMGRLAMRGREQPLFVPCTPRGCLELLDRYNIAIEGKNAVVIGRSNIVGVPVALMLLHRNATVQICHSRTQDIAKKVREADIVIAACGIAQFVKGDWIKQGAVVIDVGINAVTDSSRKTGYRLVGDVDFEEAKLRAGAITPVPRGVGPMTIAMLMRNTFDSFKRHNKLQ